MPSTPSRVVHDLVVEAGEKTPTEDAAEVHLLCGLPAAGKSTVARQLDQTRPAVRFTLDEWMLRLHALPYDDPQYAELSGRCQELIWSTAQQVLFNGVDVVLDWNQWSRRRRAHWRDKALRAGHGVRLHHVDVPVEVAVERARRRGADGSQQWTHDLDAAGIHHLARLFERPTEDEGLPITHVGP